MKASLFHKIKKDCDSFGITAELTDARCILVGFSGGADSSLLLCFLNELHRYGGAPVFALHVNHSIRGEEALRDEEFCRRRCGDLGIPFVSVTADVPSLAAERGLGIEECARLVRYSEAERIREGLLRGDFPGEGGAFLTEAMGRCGRVLFATAHNGDDNLESVILNLCRGTGAAGLSGIAPLREDGVVRPLLGLGGEYIRRCCEEEGIPFVTDSTNGDTEYRRNFVRHNILPLLREINPEVTSAALRGSLLLREDDGYLRKLSAGLISEGLFAVEGEYAEVPRAPLAEAPMALTSRAVMTLTKRLTDTAPGESHISAACRLIKESGTGSVSFPDRVTLEVSRYKVSLRREGLCEYGEFSSYIDIPQRGQVIRRTCKEGGFDLILSGVGAELPEDGEKIYKLSIHTAVRFDTIYGKVSFRTLLPGDRYVLGGHRRRITKMLSERGISESIRSRLPVFCDEHGIIWVPGIPVRGESYAPAGCDAVSIFFGLW